MTLLEWKGMTSMEAGLEAPPQKTILDEFDEAVRRLYISQTMEAGLEAPQLLGLQLPTKEERVQAIFDWAESNPVGFAEDLRTKGRTPDTETVLKGLGATPKDIDEILGISTQPVKYGIEEIPTLFQKALPLIARESNIDQLIGYYETRPDNLRQTLVKTGRNQDTEALIRTVYPQISEKGLEDYFKAPTPQKPVARGLEPEWENVRTGEIISASELKQRYPKGYERELDEWRLTRETALNWGSVFKVFGQALTKLPKQLGASILQAIQGEEGASVVNKDWADQLIGEAQTDLDKFSQEVSEKYAETRLPIKLRDLAELPQSMAFSLTSMGAGLAVGVPVALAPVPGARVAAWVAGTAASGAVAYQMATYQIMQSYLEAKNEDMQATRGRGLTLQEEERLKAEFSQKATEYGLWEAVPEAVSNLGFGLILTRPLTRIVGRTIAGRIIGKLGLLYGEEFLTETITQKGQSDIEVEAGLREGKITLVEAFKEVAPQTFLLTTVLGGLGQVGVSSVQKIKQSLKREASVSAIFQDINENITENVFGEVEAEAQSWMARIVEQARIAPERGAIGGEWISGERWEAISVPERVELVKSAGLEGKVASKAWIDLTLEEKRALARQPIPKEVTPAPEVTTKATITQTELGGIRYVWVRLEGRPSVNVGRAAEGLSRESLIERAKNYWAYEDKVKVIAGSLREKYNKQVYVGTLPTTDVATDLSGNYAYVLKDRKKGGKFQIEEAVSLEAVTPEVAIPKAEAGMPASKVTTRPRGIGRGIPLSKMDKTDFQNWVGNENVVEGKIKVYRGMRGEPYSLRRGDFVTTNREYAKTYGENITEHNIPVEELNYFSGVKGGDPKLLGTTLGGSQPTELIYTGGLILKAEVVTPTAPAVTLYRGEPIGVRPISEGTVPFTPDLAVAQGWAGKEGRVVQITMTREEFDKLPFQKLPDQIATYRVPQDIYAKAEIVTPTAPVTPKVTAITHENIPQLWHQLTFEQRKLLAPDWAVAPWWDIPPNIQAAIKVKLPKVKLPIPKAEPGMPEVTKEAVTPTAPAVAIPKAEAGMPEAGLQPSMLPEEVAAREVRPPGKGRITQLSMDEQLVYEQQMRSAEIEGLKAWLSTEPAAKLTNLIKKTGWYKGEIKNLTLKQYRDVTGKTDIKPNIMTPDKKHVKWEYALDETATELGYPDGDALKEAIEQAGEANLRIKQLEKPISKEIFTGITEVEEIPTVVVEEKITPPAPPVQPPQTVEVPVPPPSPDAKNRIISQSQEVVRQSMPGAINRLFQKIPGIKQIMQWERPGLRAFAENNPHLLVAQVAETASRSEVHTRAIASRLPLFKRLYEVFGERALRGEKTNIKFLGTEKQAQSPITGTLLDIAQNPELYELTPKQLSTIKAINEHNDAMLDYVVNGYGAEIGRFAPKPNGAFLSNVDISEDMMAWFENESRAVAQGRGKTRFWQTARDRMVADKTFQPELDVKKLIEGMDSFKASQAAGVTFKEVAGGKTRLEAIQETHPELYNRMMALRKELQSLKRNLANLETRLEDRVTEFLESPAEDIDLATLQESLDVRLQKGRFVEFNIEALQDQIDTTREQIKELRTPWKVANPKPYVLVQEGLYRYFKPQEAKYIIDSRKTTNNPILNFIERWRGQAFSGDFSPFAIQGMLGVLADPIGSLKATFGGIQAAKANKDLFHSITVDGLIDDINSDIEGWAEFASLMGRELTGVPREYAAGFLSSIPGFDKFTETTYITVTRGSKNLYDRTWQGLVKNGVPENEAKVAAIEVASKVYPLVSPAKLGQSQARAAVLRAMPTSYSFIRQPATLIAQASMGYAKLATFQKLTPQERIAIVNVTRMAGSVLAVSATSAVLSAIAQGKDDDDVWQAFLDAINPDPYNGKFASIIIRDFRIPLGGPYRAIFRAIYPQEVKGIPFPVPFAGIPRFVFNRITPAVKTQINLLRNKDYYGQQIIKGQFPENIIRVVLYEMEGALPLSGGELLAGWRRDEFFDDILQQTVAQFVGVNLMKLDNTYFHKLVKNLGLRTMETPPLYSDKRPYSTTKDLWSGVTRVLSDVTLDEVKKRKGYPKHIAVIIEARDLKREVDLLPNYSPVSLKPEDVLGEKGYYTQWTQRQSLVDAGDDAVWVTQELVGGRYKEITHKGEAALKAFDKEYPQAERGNMSQRQYALLVEYHAITDENLKKQFLVAHPEVGINPRDEYLRTHPKENAQLAVWGQAKLYSMEAYNQFNQMLKSLDIPDAAIPELTLPPKESVESYFKYQEMENKNSWEAQLLLAKDKELTDFLKREPITTPIASLELKVKNRVNFDKLDAFSDKESPDYIADDKAREKAIKDFKVANPAFVDDIRRIEAIEKGTDKVPIDDKLVNAHVDYGKLIDQEGIGSSSAEAMLFRVDNPDYDAFRTDVNIWGDQALKPIDESRIPVWRIDAEWREQDAEYEAMQARLRKEYLQNNPDYATARTQRDGWQLGLKDVTKWVEYHDLPDYGFWKERYRMNNPEWDAEVRTLQGDDAWMPTEPNKIPNEQYDFIYEEFKDLFDQYSKAQGIESERKAIRQRLFAENPAFRENYIRREGYGILIPDRYVENYVTYNLMPVSGYVRERFLAINRNYYTSVYMNTKYYPSGHDPIDFKKVPSERVENLYNQYNRLPTGNMRVNFRYNNPELDEWLLLTGKVSQLASEQLELTAEDRRKLKNARSQEEINRLLDEIREKLGR